MCKSDCLKSLLWISYFQITHRHFIWSALLSKYIIVWTAVVIGCCYGFYFCVLLLSKFFFLPSHLKEQIFPLLKKEKPKKSNLIEASSLKSYLLYSTGQVLVNTPGLGVHGEVRSMSSKNMKNRVFIPTKLAMKLWMPCKLLTSAAQTSWSCMRTSLHFSLMRR